ncbi:hypothetical protein ACNVED_10810 [Legionella sp. D16C41]|uniref:hypothetical protein n=1 Tax=Legionella sp. D16C41 TaxID=3402688 RepID=UPI003AF80936
MKLAKIILTFCFFSLPTFAAPEKANCPDLKQTTLIGQDLKNDFEQKICQKTLSPLQAKWLIKNSLPKVMNKEFLGVEPPANWDLLANNLIDTCYKQGDLCKKEIRREFNNCLKTTVPLLLVQLGPWFGDNCQLLNQGIIKNWTTRKETIDKLIQEYLNTTIKD